MKKEKAWAIFTKVKFVDSSGRIYPKSVMIASGWEAQEAAIFAKEKLKAIFKERNWDWRDVHDTLDGVDFNLAEVGRFCEPQGPIYVDLDYSKIPHCKNLMCNKPFTKRHHKQLYCSEVCKNKKFKPWGKRTK